MKDESLTNALFFHIWETFLRLKYPEADADMIDMWKQGVSLQISDNELLCIFDAPIEWAEFKEFYDTTIATMHEAIVDGVNNGAEV